MSELLSLHEAAMEEMANSDRAVRRGEIDLARAARRRALQHAVTAYAELCEHPPDRVTRAIIERSIATAACEADEFGFASLVARRALSRGDVPIELREEMNELLRSGAAHSTREQSLVHDPSVVVEHKINLTKPRELQRRRAAFVLADEATASGKGALSTLVDAITAYARDIHFLSVDGAPGELRFTAEVTLLDDGVRLQRELGQSGRLRDAQVVLVEQPTEGLRATMVSRAFQAREKRGTQAERVDVTPPRRSSRPDVRVGSATTGARSFSPLLSADDLERVAGTLPDAVPIPAATPAHLPAVLPGALSTGSPRLTSKPS